MKLATILILIFATFRAQGFCIDDGNVDSSLKAKFKITKVAKARVSCGRDEKGNVQTDGNDPELKTEACEISMRDLKTKKVYLVYAGLKGCSYKAGQTEELNILSTCCGGDNAATCNVKAKEILFSDYSI